MGEEPWHKAQWRQYQQEIKAINDKYNTIVADRKREYEAKVALLKAEFEAWEKPYRDARNDALDQAHRDLDTRHKEMEDRIAHAKVIENL